MAAVGSWQFVKPPQYVIEKTYGVFPQDASMRWIGASARVQPLVDQPPVPVYAMQEEDPVGFGTRLSPQRVIIDYIMQEPNSGHTAGDNFARFAVNAQAELESPSNSLSILWSIRTGEGIERFFLLLGSRANNISLGIGTESELRVSQEMQGVKLLVGDTPPEASVVYATDPLTRPLSFIGGVKALLGYNKRTVILDSLTLKLDRGSRPIPQMLSAEAVEVKTGPRIVTGQVKMLWLNRDNYVDLTALSETSLDWQLSSLGPNVALTMTRLHRLEGMDIDVNQTITETYGFTAARAVIY